MVPKSTLSQALARLSSESLASVPSDSESIVSTHLEFSQHAAALLSQEQPTDHKVTKRFQEFKELFPDTYEEERLIEDYSCALEKDILIQGRMYITQYTIYFYGKILGWIHTARLPFVDVVQIERRNVAAIIPNSLEIKTEDDETYFFASFLHRDIVYDLLIDLWKSPESRTAPIKLKTIVRVDADQDFELPTDDTIVVRGDAIDELDESSSLQNDAMSIQSDQKCKSTSIDDHSTASTISGSSSPVPMESFFGSALKKMVGSFRENPEALVKNQAHPNGKRVPKGRSSSRTKVAPASQVINEEAMHASVNDPSATSSLFLTTLLSSSPPKNGSSKGLAEIAQRGSTPDQSGVEAESDKQSDHIFVPQKIVHLKPLPPYNKPHTSPKLFKETKNVECSCEFDGTLVVQCELPLSILDIWKMIYSEEGWKQGDHPFYQFMVNRKNKEIQATRWDQPLPTNGISRKTSFIAALSNPIGPRQTKCESEENVVNCCQGAFIQSLCVKSQNQTPDVPSGNSFVTHVLVCLASIGPDKTRMKAQCKVEWIKSSWLKLPIEKGVVEGMKNYYKDLAEFLSQQHGKLNKQILSPVPEETVPLKEMNPIQIDEFQQLLLDRILQPRWLIRIGCFIAFWSFLMLYKMEQLLKRLGK